MYHMFHHGCWWWKAAWRRDAVIWCYMMLYEYQEFEVLPSDVNSLVIFGRLWGNFEYLYADQPAGASNSTNQGVGYIPIYWDIDGYCGMVRQEASIGSRKWVVPFKLSQGVAVFGQSPTSWAIPNVRRPELLAAGHIYGFPKMELPQNGGSNNGLEWKIPFKWMIWRYPHFGTSSYYGFVW